MAAAGCCRRCFPWGIGLGWGGLKEKSFRDGLQRHGQARRGAGWLVGWGGTARADAAWAGERRRRAGKSGWRGAGGASGGAGPGRHGLGGRWGQGRAGGDGAGQARGGPGGGGQSGRMGTARTEAGCTWGGMGCRWEWEGLGRAWAANVGVVGGEDARRAGKATG